MSENSAENYDVAARLAQGRSAVDTVQQYVSACHQLGYHHQDLTLHPAQVRDWYSTEDGMDLGALQRGCLSLEAAVRVSQDALSVQDRQVAQMSAVWQGVGGETARDFLRRHGDASAAVAAAVRTASEALVALREDLWRAVSTKVDTVVAIEARAAGSRAEWLTAATAVTTGVGDLSGASELVDGAVEPFVDNSIRGDWLAAMQAAVASVNAAYERAVREIQAEQPPTFDIPGDLGPVWSPPASVCDDEPRCEAPAGREVSLAPAATAPSGWSGGTAAPVAAAAPPPPPATFAPPAAFAPPPAPAALAAPVEPPVAPPPAAAPPLPLGGMGSAIPDMGGGLSGLGQQFADTLSGLLGGAGGGLLGGANAAGAEGEMPGLPEPDLPEPDLEPEEESQDDEDLQEEEKDEVVEPEEADLLPVDEAVVTGEAASEADPCEPAPAPTPAPLPAEPLPPPAEPVAAEQTPCEIAADEVPQVGEPAE